MILCVGNFTWLLAALFGKPLLKFIGITFMSL